MTTYTALPQPAPRTRGWARQLLHTANRPLRRMARILAAVYRLFLFWIPVLNHPRLIYIYAYITVLWCTFTAGLWALVLLFS